MKAKDKTKKKQPRIIRVFRIEADAQQMYSNTTKEILDAVKQHMKFTGRSITISSMEITRAAWLTRFKKFQGWRD